MLRQAGAAVAASPLRSPRLNHADVLVDNVGKEITITGYLVTTKPTRTSRGEYMAFGKSSSFNDDLPQNPIQCSHHICDQVLVLNSSSNSRVPGLNSLLLIAMKKLLFVFIFLPFLLTAQSSFMSFNLRYNNPGDKENCWEYRKAEVADMLNRYHPAILGIQEGLQDQVLFLDSALKNYDYTGVGRDDGKTKGEYAAIFYNTRRFRLLSMKTYWLSETPDTVSVGWDAAMERIATFASFSDLRTNDTLCVFNMHLDHIGVKAREESARLILRLIDQLQLWNKRLVVMGDFNATPDEKPVKLYAEKLQCFYNSSRETKQGPPGTFNAFNTTDPVTKRIDYIFTKNISISHYQHIADRRINNLWLSDHLPVMAW